MLLVFGLAILGALANEFLSWVKLPQPQRFNACKKPIGSRGMFVAALRTIRLEECNPYQAQPHRNSSPLTLKFLLARPAVRSGIKALPAGAAIKIDFTRLNSILMAPAGRLAIFRWSLDRKALF